LEDPGDYFVQVGALTLASVDVRGDRYPVCTADNRDGSSVSESKGRVDAGAGFKNRVGYEAASLPNENDQTSDQHEDSREWVKLNFIGDFGMILV
jgi:hypothetical protein